MSGVAEKALSGRHAIVTGASRGIGKAIATRLASAGAHVILAALALVPQPSQYLTGTIAWSYKHLDEIARPTMSLDGKQGLVERSELIQDA